jgi:hypothetical protein
MFKKVEYAGFTGNPELRALAEKVVAILADVVREWDKQIEVELEAYSDRPEGVEVSVTLVLPTAIGSGSRFLTRDEIRNADVLESRCRAIWGRAMDADIERRKPAWDEIINQPAEA